MIILINHLDINTCISFVDYMFMNSCNQLTICFQTHRSICVFCLTKIKTYSPQSDSFFQIASIFPFCLSSQSQTSDIPNKQTFPHITICLFNERQETKSGQYHYLSCFYVSDFQFFKHGPMLGKSLIKELISKLLVSD